MTRELLFFQGLYSVFVRTISLFMTALFVFLLTNLALGDLKADYLVIWDAGGVDAYLNQGNLNSDLNSRNWADVKNIAPGIHGVPREMILLVDIDGTSPLPSLLLLLRKLLQYFPHKYTHTDRERTNGRVRYRRP